MVRLNDDVHTRPASASDLRALAGGMSRLRLLRDRLKRRDAGGGELLVAVRGRIPVGHIYVWTDPAEEPELREHLSGVPLIMNLWVHEDHRRRGVGRRLVDAAEAWLYERGYLQVALGVEPGNTDATRLYLALDYDPWPHPDVKTEREEFLANGDRVRIPETCAVLVKNIQAPRPTPRARRAGTPKSANLLRTQRLV
jgi:GNAT superfamily N-acetyltransferase